MNEIVLNFIYFKILMIKNQNHISSLNLFRGIAGYGVAICHFYYYLLHKDEFQFYSIFFVDFFFVLSGFVLYPQLIKVYKNRRQLKIFYYRRWFRTLPVYILALLCYSFLFSKFDGDTIKFLFFVQKITSNFINFDYFSVAWSLSIEEFFYLLFPLFLIFLNNKNFLHILLIFIGIIYFIKILYLLNNFDQEFYRVGTLLRLDAIALGILTRIYLNKIDNFFYNILCLFSASLIILFFYENINNLIRIELFIFILLIQLISINSILIFININFLIKNKFLINLFSLFSNQTYSIYLFHFLIIYIFSNYLQIIGNNFLIFYYVGSLFILSTVCFYLFEKPILEKRPSYED